MALIKCPECGNKISDKAEICPKCGYELNSNSNNLDSNKTMKTGFKAIISFGGKYV